MTDLKNYIEEQLQPANESLISSIVGKSIDCAWVILCLATLEDIVNGDQNTSDSQIETLNIITHIGKKKGIANGILSWSRYAWNELKKCEFFAEVKEFTDELKETQTYQFISVAKNKVKAIEECIENIEEKLQKNKKILRIVGELWFFNIQRNKKKYFNLI